MEPAHYHLLTNHIPILGTVFSIALFIGGMLFRNKSIENAALVAFVIVGVLTLPAYFSGEEAEEAVEHLPGITHALIHEHEEAAEWALRTVSVTAILALFILILMRLKKVEARGFKIALIVVALFTSTVVVRTGYLGGQIRHSEIRGGSALESNSPTSDGEHEMDDDD